MFMIVVIIMSMVIHISISHIYIYILSKLASLHLPIGLFKFLRCKKVLLHNSTKVWDNFHPSAILPNCTMWKGGLCPIKTTKLVQGSVQSSFCFNPNMVRDLSHSSQHLARFLVTMCWLCCFPSTSCLNFFSSSAFMEKICRWTTVSNWVWHKRKML